MSKSSTGRDGRIPNWVMNSFGNRNFMQPMGRPNLQSRCLPSFPIKFGGRGGGRGWEEDFFGGFPCFRLCSFQVPNNFPSCFQYVPQVLNVFPNMLTLEQYLLLLINVLFFIVEEAFIVPWYIPSTYNLLKGYKVYCELYLNFHEFT